MKIQQFFEFCIYHIEKIYYKVYYILNNIMGTNGGDCFLKKIGTIIAIVSAALLIVFLVYDGMFNKHSSKDFFAMDTVISAKVTGRDSDLCVEKIEKLVTDLDGILSRHDKKSEVTALNSGVSDGVISDRLLGYLHTLIDISRKSGGAFDFTIGALSDLWSFGKNPKIPDGRDISAALTVSGYEKLSLEGNRVTKPDGMLIDFGATGKGIALDEIRTSLENSDAKSAVISVGGSVLLYGKEKVTVGIRDPYGNAGRSIASVELSNTCVSTSGSYERCFEVNGKNYHHILDPETGYPVDNGLISVTVISESGVVTDALSTACFVLGIENGMKLAEEYGCEAIFITADKKICTTEKVSSEIRITDSDYTFMNYES